MIYRIDMMTSGSHTPNKIVKSGQLIVWIVNQYVADVGLGWKRSIDRIEKVPLYRHMPFQRFPDLLQQFFIESAMDRVESSGWEYHKFILQMNVDSINPP